MLLNPKFNLVCLCIMKTFFFFFYLIILPLGTINAWLQIHTDLFRAGSPMGNAARAMYPAFYVGRVSWVKACCIKVVKKIKET